MEKKGIDWITVLTGVLVALDVVFLVRDIKKLKARLNGEIEEV